MEKNMKAMTEQELRLEAARRLVEKPWRHIKATKVEEGWGIVDLPYCRKCGGSLKGPCSVLDPDTRPMPVIVHDLLRKVLEQEDGVSSIFDTIERHTEMGMASSQFVWWLNATPAEQAAICLQAMEGGEG